KKKNYQNCAKVEIAYCINHSLYIRLKGNDFYNSFIYSERSLYAVSESAVRVVSSFGPILFNKTSMAFIAAFFTSSIGTFSPLLDLDKATNSSTCGN
ncbi:MAG TPA: hypothetical protein VE619_09430, partial [Nitrososphaeraceae archaeon]|nr:hypothetical protein [Nitrososphaeraceae archaeon]